MLLAGQHPGDRGLARAALADQRDDRAAVQAEGDVTDRVQHLAAAEPEVLAQRVGGEYEAAARGGDRHQPVGGLQRLLTGCLAAHGFGSSALG